VAWAVLALVACSVVGIIVAAVGPMLAIVGVLALVVGLVAVRWPGVLLAAYLLSAFYKAAIAPYTPVDITAALALLNALQVIPVAWDHRRWNVSWAAVLLFTCVAVLLFGGILYAPDQGLAFGRAAGFWGLVLVPIIPAAIRVGSDPRHVRHVLWAFFAMGALVVVLGSFQLLATGTGRLTVLGENTIQVARAALFVPILGLTFVLRQGPAVVRVGTIVLIPVAVLVALASGSRGPIIMLVVMAAVALLRGLARPRQVDWRLGGLVAAIVLASAVFLAIAAASLPGRSVERFALFGDFIQQGLSGDLGATTGDTSSGTRVSLFGAAISLFENQPVLGTGTAGYQALSSGILGPGGDAYPHNAVLQFAAEFGLVGVALFAGIVVLALTRRLPPGSTYSAIRTLFVFFVLNAMVSGDIFSDRETWGLLMLVALVDVPRRTWGRDGRARRNSEGT
jgi:O-antigen ligase